MPPATSSQHPPLDGRSIRTQCCPSSTTTPCRTRSSTKTRPYQLSTSLVGPPTSSLLRPCRRSKGRRSPGHPTRHHRPLLRLLNPRSQWLPRCTGTTPRCLIPRCCRLSIPVLSRHHGLTIRCRSKALCLTHLNPVCRTTTTRNHNGHRHPGPLHTPHRYKSRHRCRQPRRLQSWPLPQHP